MAQPPKAPALLARINEKKAELAHLKELQALSAGLADQMEQLESKLGMLSNGTEGTESVKTPMIKKNLTEGIAVATVLANWGSVLRAISMASSKLPKPKEDEPAKQEQLPQTLVRIPTQSSILTPQTTTGTSGP